MGKMTYIEPEERVRDELKAKMKSPGFKKLTKPEQNKIKGEHAILDRKVKSIYAKAKKIGQKNAEVRYKKKQAAKKKKAMLTKAHNQFTKPDGGFTGK